MSESKALSLVGKMASKFGVDGGQFFNTLKATAFKQKDGSAPTNEQMMALMVVADQYGLNPFTKEIYAFPDKSNGIVPVVGVDGWCRIINEHPEFDGMAFTSSQDEAKLDEHHKRCPSSVTCVMYRKDRSHPIEATEYLDEVYRAPFKGKYGPVIGPWQSHTKRMLRHKAMIQTARLAFGFVGIYDKDEAERIVEAQVARSGGVVEAEFTAVTGNTVLTDDEKNEMNPHLERLAARAMTSHAWEAALGYVRERYTGARQAYAVEYINAKADAVADAQFAAAAVEAQLEAETPPAEQPSDNKGGDDLDETFGLTE